MAAFVRTESAALNSTLNVPNGWPRQLGTESEQDHAAAIDLHVERRRLAVQVLLADQVAGSSGDPASWYRASTRPLKPSSVSNTGLLSANTAAFSGSPAITWCARSVVTSTIVPCRKKSSGPQAGDDVPHRQLELLDRERARAVQADRACRRRGRTARTPRDRPADSRYAYSGRTSRPGPPAAAPSATACRPPPRSAAAHRRRGSPRRPCRSAAS